MRTHYCTAVNESSLEKEVTVCGWVHHRRDHGGVIFLDVRDSSGLLQVVYEPDNKETFLIAEKLRSEFVVSLPLEAGLSSDFASDETGLLLSELDDLFAVPLFLKSVTYQPVPFN